MLQKLLRTMGLTTLLAAAAFVAPSVHAQADQQKLVNHGGEPRCPTSCAIRK